MEAMVVGAGIGGLTAAAALSQDGWSVRVLERADALEDVGAGLGVAPNALRVLDLLGAGERVRALAALQVYCYAMAYAPAGGRADDELQLLRQLFGSWHQPIPELLAAADPAAVLRNDVYDLPTPLTPFHLGRTALLGDAAHAMTPNLGQGACQAIEDAAVLAYHVRTGTEGLAAYTAARRPRTTSVVRRSRRMMRTAQLSQPVAVAARDAGMAAARLLTADMTARIFLGVAGWRPPQEDVTRTA